MDAQKQILLQALDDTEALLRQFYEPGQVRQYITNNFSTDANVQQVLLALRLVMTDWVVSLEPKEEFAEKIIQSIAGALYFDNPDLKVAVLAKIQSTFWSDLLDDLQDVDLEYLSDDDSDDDLMENQFADNDRNKENESPFDPNIVFFPNLRM